MVELPFKPLRSHTRSHSLFHYKLGETYSFLSLQDPRFKLSCYLSVFIFLSYKNNTIQAELTTRLHVFSFTHTHTHTYMDTHTYSNLQLTRAFLVPIKSQLPNIKFHDCGATRKYISAHKSYL